jgi:hypothetical protein
VRLTADHSSVNNPQDMHTISRMLPAHANVWQYRVKRVSDGQERAVDEAQLVKVTPEERTGRTQIEAQEELQRARNMNARGRAQSATRRTDRDRR